MERHKTHGTPRRKPWTLRVIAGSVAESTACAVASGHDYDPSDMTDLPQDYREREPQSFVSFLRRVYHSGVKIRCQGQSLRLRLGRSEVARLGRGEGVEDRTQFTPDFTLAVALRPAAAVHRLTVDHEAGIVVIRLPAAQAADWAASEEVSLSAEVPAGDGLTLHVLIEKDFQCLDRPAHVGEDADAFPNPSKVCR